MARLEYTWWVQRRGFFRNTLDASRCDVVIGVPKGLDIARTTKPWYRSTYALVSRADSGLADLRSIDDPRLRTLRIGVQLAGDDGANPPPIHALARRGIVDRVRGFPLYAEVGREVPAAIEAVAERGAAMTEHVFPGTNIVVSDEGPTIDVTDLPRHGFGRKPALFWGVLAFIAIETTALAIMFASYLYVRATSTSGLRANACVSRRAS